MHESGCRSAATWSSKGINIAVSWRIDSPNLSREKDEKKRKPESVLGVFRITFNAMQVDADQADHRL